MSLSLVLAGHSHLAALAAPVDPVAETIAPVTVEGRLMALTGPTDRDDAYWAALAEAAAGGAVPAIVWQGTQHLDRFQIEPFPPLDFVLSLAPRLPLDPRASYVAEGQLRALFAPAIAPLGNLVARLRATGAPAVIVCGTPPPAGDAEAVRNRLIARAGDAAGELETARLSSPYTLQKLWSLVQAMMAEVSAANGAVFVAVPDRLRGTDGFLPLAMLADDAVHGNAEYGRAMREEIAAAASRLLDRGQAA